MIYEKQKSNRRWQERKITQKNGLKEAKVLSGAQSRWVSKYEQE
jgi:hypothetical protein